MKSSIIALTLLSISSFSFNSQASVIETYSVNKSITGVVEQGSGLPKTECSFYDNNGVEIVKQEVTIAEQWDDLTLIEADLDYQEHSEVVTIICED